jgi:hypothetical protein
MRPESVGEEFVNCHLRLEDLKSPSIETAGFDSSIAGASFFHDQLLAFVGDWGAGLDTGLYEEALTHFLGGEERVLLPVPVLGAKGHLHDQKMRLLAPEVAFKLTSFPSRLQAFETHARRLLQHTRLEAIHWANITHSHINFRTIC